MKLILGASAALALAACGDNAAAPAQTADAPAPAPAQSDAPPAPSPAAAAAPSAPGFPGVGEIEIFDSAAEDLISPNAKIEKLTDDTFGWSEGPVWIKQGGYLLFTDVPGNTLYRWDEEDGLSVFLRPSGLEGDDPAIGSAGLNGLLDLGNGKILGADHGNRRVGTVDLTTKTKATIVDRFEGKRFNSPNDMILSSTGALYFTDPPYGLAGGNDSSVKELPHNGVYHLSALDGGTLTLIDDTLTWPNGIALSPDEDTLYVAVSDSEATVLHTYTLDENGMPGTRDMFFDASPLQAAGLPGLADGMAVDVDGNVWATGPGGVHVIDPLGNHLAMISTGTAIANVTFGDDGSVLYMTSASFLARVQTKTKGLGF